MKVIIAIIIVAIVILGIYLTRKPGDNATSGHGGIHHNEPENPDDKDNEDKFEQ